MVKVYWTLGDNCFSTWITLLLTFMYTKKTLTVQHMLMLEKFTVSTMKSLNSELQFLLMVKYFVLLLVPSILATKPIRCFDICDNSLLILEPSTKYYSNYEVFLSPIRMQERCKSESDFPLLLVRLSVPKSHKVLPMVAYISYGHGRPRASIRPSM